MSNRYFVTLVVAFIVSVASARAHTGTGAGSIVGLQFGATELPAVISSSAQAPYTVIEWKDVQDHVFVKDRKLGNKMALQVMGPSQYVLIPENPDDMDNPTLVRAPGVYGGTEIQPLDPSKPPTTNMNVGRLNEKKPDEMFYSLFGVGSSLVLADQEVQLFGLLCKGGKLTITDRGLEFSAGAEFRKPSQ